MTLHAKEKVNVGWQRTFVAISIFYTFLIWDVIAVSIRLTSDFSSNYFIYSLPVLSVLGVIPFLRIKKTFSGIYFGVFLMGGSFGLTVILFSIFAIYLPYAMFIVSAIVALIVFVKDKDHIREYSKEWNKQFIVESNNM